MNAMSDQQADPLFTTRQDGNTVAVSVAADLIHPAAHQVRVALLEVLEARPRRVLIDLTRVQAIDETGLGALLITALWARKFSAELAVIPSPSARSRLTTARLDGYLTLVEPG